MNPKRIGSRFIFLLVVGLLIILSSSLLPKASAAPNQLRNNNNPTASYTSTLPLPAEIYTCSSSALDKLVYLPLILKGQQGGPVPPAQPAGADSLGLKSHWSYISLTVGDHGLLVNLGTGNLLLGYVDQDILTPGIDSSLLRTYNSRSPYAGEFGSGWIANIGNSWRLAPQPDGSIAFFGPSGEIELFTPQAGGFISPPGFHYTLARQGDGTYTLTEIDGGIRFNFTSQGQLSSIADRNGNTQSYQRDATGKVVKIVDSVGQSITLTYETNRVKEIKDRAGRASQYSYNAAGALERYVNPAGNVTKYHYDSCGKLAELVDAGKNTWSFGYDNLGRVVLSTDPLGHTTQFTYQNNTTLVTDANGYNTVYQVDAQGKLMERIGPNGHRFQFAWDQFFNLIRVTSSLNHQTQFSWKGNTGLLTSVTDALGNRISYSYNSHNNLSSITDARNNVTQFSYDPAGANLLQVTQADSSKITFTYNSRGLPLTLTDLNANAGDPSNPSGIPYRFAYNTYGYLTDVYDPLNNHWTYGWDNARGKLLNQRDAKGQFTRYSYDNLDRLIQIAYDDEIVGFSFDALSHLINMRDRRGTNTYTYDAAGQLVTEDDPRTPGITRYSYDPVGNLSQIIRENGHVLNFSYDRANRLISQSNPFDGDKLIAYGYDADDRLVNIVYSNGDQTSYTYYPNDWLQSLLTTGGDGTIYNQYTYPSQAQGGYDGNGNPLKFTRTFANFNDQGQLDWTTQIWQIRYDAMDRLIQQDGYDNQGVWQWQVTINYNPNGLWATRTYQDNTQSQSWNYSYDADSRWTGISYWDGRRDFVINDANGNQTQIVEESFTSMASAANLSFSSNSLDEAKTSLLLSPIPSQLTSNLVSTSAIVTHTTTFEYDAADRLVRVTDPVGNWSTFNYDGFDRIIEMNNSGFNTPKYQYYDLLGMARETQGIAAVNYLNDLAGNVRSSTVESFSTQYLHRDPRGQISHISDKLDKYFDYCFMGNVQASGISPDGATYEPFLSTGLYTIGLEGAGQAGVLYHKGGGQFWPHNSQLDLQNSPVAQPMNPTNPKTYSTDYDVSDFTEDELDELLAIISDERGPHNPCNPLEDPDCWILKKAWDANERIQKRIAKHLDARHKDIKTQASLNGINFLLKSLKLQVVLPTLPPPAPLQIDKLFWAYDRVSRMP